MKQKQLRYVEISRRNPVTRIKLGSGSSCNAGTICGSDDVFILLSRAGSENCHPVCDYRDNPCSCNSYRTTCCMPFAKVCALEIDDYGYAVFHWPKELMEMKQGWYEGEVYTGCSFCGKFPVRIGPRCNVLEVETTIIGPDSLCAVGCNDDPCVDGPCHPKYTTHRDNNKIYVPNYEVL